MIKVAYGDQVMWPDHCMQNTEDAQIAKAINIPQANLIIRKCFRKDVDGYWQTRRPIRGWQAISPRRANEIT
jgi:hypothetical protein